MAPLFSFFTFLITFFSRSHFPTFSIRGEKFFCTFFCPILITKNAPQSENLVRTRRKSHPPKVWMLHFQLTAAITATISDSGAREKCVYRYIIFLLLFSYEIFSVCFRNIPEKFFEFILEFEK